MLAEVAGSSLEPTPIKVPRCERSFPRRTVSHRGEVKSIDLKAGKWGFLFAARVWHRHLRGEGTLAYDHLVLALGIDLELFRNENVRLNSFDFKTLLDAIRDSQSRHRYVRTGRAWCDSVRRDNYCVLSSLAEAFAESRTGGSTERLCTGNGVTIWK